MADKIEIYDAYIKIGKAHIEYSSFRCGWESAINFMEAQAASAKIGAQPATVAAAERQPCNSYKRPLLWCVKLVVNILS